MSKSTKGFRQTVLTPMIAALKQEGNKKGRRYLTIERQLARHQGAREREIEKINAKYDKKTRPLANERVKLGNRLLTIATKLIPLLNPGEQHVQLRTIRLQLKQMPDRLEVDDPAAALKRIADEGWTDDCVRTRRDVLRDPLAKKLTADGKRRRMRGTRWTPGNRFLYVNGTKVELTDPDEATAEGLSPAEPTPEPRRIGRQGGMRSRGQQ